MKLEDPPVADAMEKGISDEAVIASLNDDS